MTWSRFDDGYDEHEQVEDAWHSFPANPVGLHVMATTACNRWQSDGVIKPRWLMAKLPDRRVRERILAAMVEYELFDLIPAGEAQDYIAGDGEVVTLGPFESERYVVHGFFKFHDSAAKREREREWDRRRKELERDRDLIDAIRARDQDRCRYCGILVNWRDRRSPKGGTYDHVIPRGDNSPENVVVACRGCNGRKGARTPAEAQMPLLAPGQVAARSGVETSGRGSRSVQTPLPDQTLPDHKKPPQPPASGGSGESAGGDVVELRKNSRADKTNPRALAAAEKTAAATAAARTLVEPTAEQREAWTELHDGFMASTSGSVRAYLARAVLAGVDGGVFVVDGDDVAWGWLRNRARDRLGPNVRIATPDEHVGREVVA